MGKKNAKKVVMGLFVMAMIVTFMSVPKKTSEAAVVKISAVKATLYVGGETKKKISLTVKKGFTDLTGQCIWTSGNKRVATVGRTTGLVTAVNAGRVVITAKYEKKVYRCTVTVKHYKYAYNVTTDKSSLRMHVGKTEKIGVKYYGFPTTTGVTFKSSNAAVASVSSMGVVTAKKVGTAKITVETKKGVAKKILTRTVTITVLAGGEEVSEEDYEDREEPADTLEDTETPVVTSTPEPTQQETPVATSTPKPVQQDTPVVKNTPAPVQTTQPIVIPTGTADGWGKLGDNINWYFYASSGVLELKGTGAMEDGKSPWSDYKDQIKAVKIGSGITRVGDSAFYNHSKLAQVELADTVTELGEDAFHGSGLVSIDLSYITDLGEGCFSSCEGLGNVVIPVAIGEIPGSAFSYCASLKNVTISEGIKGIGSSAFYRSGIEKIGIPASVKSIGYEAFSGCEQLTGITIPSTVDEVGNYICYDCNSIKWVEWASSCDIPYQAFDSCDNLRVVKISGLIKKIEYGAFTTGWTEATIGIFVPASVTEINGWNDKTVFYSYPDTEAYYKAGQNKEISFVDVSTATGMNQWNTLWNQVTSGK